MNSCAFANTLSYFKCCSQISVSLPLICCNHLMKVFNLIEKFVSVPGEVIETIDEFGDNMGIKLYAYNPDLDIVFNENDTIIPVSEYFRSYFEASGKNKSYTKNATFEELVEQQSFSQLLHLGHGLLYLTQYFAEKSYARYKMCHLIIHTSQKLGFNVLVLGIAKSSLFTNYSQWLYEKPRKHLSIQNKFRFSISINNFLDLMSRKSLAKIDDSDDEFKLQEINETYNAIIEKVYFENYLFEGEFPLHVIECKTVSDILINALKEINFLHENFNLNLRDSFRNMLLNQYNFLENKSHYIFSDIISPQVLNVIQCCSYPISVVEYKTKQKIYFKQYLNYLFHERNLNSLIDKLTFSHNEEYLIAHSISLLNLYGPKIISVKYNDISLCPVTAKELHDLENN